MNNEVVVFVQDLLGCTDRARCKHCKHRLLYSSSKTDFEASRFVCLAQRRKFINGNGFACGFFQPKIGYTVIQSNLQLSFNYE